MKKLLLSVAFAIAAFLPMTAAGTLNSPTHSHSPYECIEVSAYDLEEGDLASWISENNAKLFSELEAAVAEASEGLPVKLKLSSGTLGKADMEAIANLSSLFTDLDIDAMTIASNTGIGDMSSSSLKHLALPASVTDLNASTLLNLTAIESAVAVDGEDCVAYVAVPGTLWQSTRMIPANSDQDKLKNVTNVKISGYVNASDVSSSTGSVFLSKEDTWDGEIFEETAFGQSKKQSSIKSMDLSEATFAKMSDEGEVEAYPEYMRAFSVGGVGDTLEEIQLPTSQDYVPIYAFEQCEHLKNIDIPSNYTSIGKGAFIQCLSLTRLFIGKNITDVGAQAFVRCHALETIEFEAGIADLDFEEEAFARNEGLKHVILPEGVKTLGPKLFLGCINLESISFPESLEEIKDSCFNEDVKLSMITIPRGMKKIGKGVFQGCWINDVYLMAETVEELPIIYGVIADTDNTGNISTFGGNSLYANNTGLSAYSTIEEYAQYTFEEAEAAYRALAHDGNTFAQLHFSPSIRYYIDYNPWYPGTYKVTDYVSFPEQEYLSDTYYVVDADGKTWPSQSYWGKPTDFLRVFKAGVVDMDGNEVSYDTQAREHWRQFAFRHGDMTPGDAVVYKDIKDVWYTMCFPFNLTDEQLEMAFNAEYNIVHFTGAKVWNMGEDDMELVFYFDEVASDRDDDGNKTGYLARAAHPYMIHPNKGLSNGSPAVRVAIPAKYKMDADENGLYEYLNETDSIISYSTKPVVDGDSGEELGHYRFQGNMDEFSAEGIEYAAENPAPTFSMAYPTLATKGEEPTEVAKPDEVADPGVTFTDEDLAIYAILSDEWLWGSYDEITCSFYDESEQWKAFANNKYKMGSIATNDDLYGSNAEAFFNRCKEIFNNYAAVAAYEQYLEDLAAYEAYVAAYEAWSSYSDEKAQEEYEAAVAAYEAALAAYEAELAAWNATMAKYKKLIPFGYYFLGTKAGDYYPRYWKEKGSNDRTSGGYWTQYTAVIHTADDGADAIEAILNKNVTTGEANSHMFDFGNVETVSTDAIEKIVEEAKAQGQSVKHINVVVNIKGQVVRQGTDVEGLPSGIYIVNGKKYMVK